ncbi:MAG: S24 family peptidase [Pseudomonadota bacterium]
MANALSTTPRPYDSSSTIRAMEYIGDNMEPTICKRDSIVFEPIEYYVGEGIYLFEQLGGISVYRVQSNGRQTLRLMSDNKRYSGRECELSWFNDHCLGRLIGVYHQIFTPRGC